MTESLDPQPAWATAHGLVVLRGPDCSSTYEQAAGRILAAETVHRFAFAYDEQNHAVLTDCFAEGAVLTATTAGVKPYGPFQGTPGHSRLADSALGESR